jgi:hypothetical protein
VTRVLQVDDTFNLTAYEEYSELYLPATYAVTYLLAFALSTCVIVHTALYHGRTMLNGIKRIRIEEDDIHAKLMRHYPEVPDWWYLFSFIFFFCCGIIAVEVRLLISSQQANDVDRLFAGLGNRRPRLGIDIVVTAADNIYSAIWVHFRYDWAGCKC